MTNYVMIPHLPQSRTALAAAGERYRGRLGAALAALGVEMLWLPDAPGADRRLAGHADLSMLHLGGNKIVCACAEPIVNYLTNRGFELFSAPGPAERYPGDCALNACIAGGHFFHRLDVTARAALENASELEMVNVAQGYAKCSVCVVDERSIITADRGIAEAARGRALEVLEITPGHVELEGFEYGFIGGAAFKLSKRELAFTGRLDAHPDYNNIIAFLDARGIAPIYLTDAPAFDVGSILPLIEK